MPEPDSAPAVHGQFTTTHWSVLLAACATQAPQARAALETLCCAYWYPLYAFNRRLGHSPADARDLTQGFFAYLLEHDLVARADRQAGRFRSFLLGSLKHFLAHEHERATALKRGGGQPLVSLDQFDPEDRYALEPPTRPPRRRSLTNAGRGSRSRTPWAACAPNTPPRAAGRSSTCSRTTSGERRTRSVWPRSRGDSI